MPRGRPKGTGGFDKERARQRLREIVWQRMDAMIEAQVSHATGIKYLVVRDAAGKFKPVKDVKAALAEGANPEDVVEVWEKEPSTQAFTDLMNRAIDKPAEQVDVNANHKGKITIKWEGE